MKESEFFTAKRSRRLLFRWALPNLSQSMNPSLSAKLEAAVAAGELLQSSFDNLSELFAGSVNPVYEASVEWLANEGHWKEVNNRFFKKLAFVSAAGIF